MRAAATPAVKDRPTVLLILQGPHHLDLFRSVLTRCRAVRWTCLIHGLEQVPAHTLEAFYLHHDVRFLADRDTALLHMGDIDAVVTTFALPDPAHLPYLGLIALAYELGLEVFELQHGLFQTGLSFQADRAVIGSGLPGGLPLRNLTDARLTWWGEEAVGYPPYVMDPAPAPEMLGPEGSGLGPVSSSLADTETVSHRNGPVAVLTNLHWTLLDPQEATAGYDMILAAVIALPDVDFVLAPHPTEMATAGFARLRDQLRQVHAQNCTVLPASDREGRAALLSRARLAVATASSVLLDLEMHRVPTVLLGLPSFEALFAALETTTVARTPEALITLLSGALDGTGYPALCTGRLVPFDPKALEQRLLAAVRKTPLAAKDYVPILMRHREPR